MSQLVALEVSICLTQNFQERIMTKESSTRGNEMLFAQLKKALSKLEKLQGQFTQTELWKPLDKREKAAKAKEVKRLENAVSKFEEEIKEKYPDCDGILLKGVR